MAYVSFFEQLTSSVSLSVLTIISTGILGLLLAYTVLGRVLSTKHVDTKKSQEEKTSTNKKKRNKAKKLAGAVSSSSLNTQSEESENEKVKQMTSKPVKQTAAPVRTEKVQNKKQSKTTGKDNTTVNTNKKPSAMVNSEVKQTVIADVEFENDEENEGQWVVTQNTKQINNRNRNKSKIESSPSAVATKSTAPLTSTIDNESNLASDQPEEPIEICELLPINENRYTANDNWWKQPLNNQQTFSVDDIGEWPEHEPDEQYIVQVKRILPKKKLSQEN